jgi:hypothetical protein
MLEPGSTTTVEVAVFIYDRASVVAFTDTVLVLIFDEPVFVTFTVAMQLLSLEPVTS